MDLVCLFKLNLLICGFHWKTKTTNIQIIGNCVLITVY